MSRITNAQIEHLIRILNDRHGYANEPYTKSADGKYTPNEGTYYLAGAYGMTRVEQVDGNGARDCSGYGTKRETYIWLRGATQESRPDNSY